MSFQLILSGLAVGAAYTLAALSIVLVFRAVSVVSFAQGDLVMIGAFLGAVTVNAGFGLWTAILVSIVGSSLVGALMYYVGYRPLRDKSFLPFVVSTIALGLILQNVAGNATNFQPLAFPTLLETQSFDVAGLIVNVQNLVTVFVVLLLVTGLNTLFAKTTLGLQLQASAQDSEMSELVGIPVATMLVITFAASGGLSAIAGLLLAPQFYVTAKLGNLLILKALAATVVGGFGSIRGAVIGGFSIGMVGVLSTAYVSGPMAELLVFVVLVLVLLVRPDGLFPEKVGNRV